MTTMTIEQAEKDIAGAIRRVTETHNPVIVKQGQRAVAVIIPADQYFEAADADIPESFWQGLKESRAGVGVDMETALHEAPPGV